ncbi:sensor histidine kinase [Dyadobacter soli]|nr:histidine kinase [Dyadobacter soli]
MKPIDLLVSKLLSSKTGVHMIFCLAFVGIFSIPVVLSGNNQVGFAGLCCCLYLLFCTYLGRWLAKLSTRRTPKGSIALLGLVAFSFWTVLGAFGAGLLFKAEPYIHFSEYLAISFPLVVLFGVLGGSVYLVRVSLTRQIKDASLRQQQQQSELELLVSQLSPHFLFNTLNNIYGLSMTQHERVPALLVKLSDLLRYSLYQTKQPFIPICNEIAYIKNYIAFERLQTDEKISFRQKIEDINDPDLLIAPMVLIVFVENAFKHSRHDQSTSPAISVRLEMSDNWLLFEVINTYSVASQHHEVSVESSGMGLTHTLRRLKLIYGNDFRYDVDKQFNEYKINLALRIITP